MGQFDHWCCRNKSIVATTTMAGPGASPRGAEVSQRGDQPSQSKGNTAFAAQCPRRGDWTDCQKLLGRLEWRGDSSRSSQSRLTRDPTCSALNRRAGSLCRPVSPGGSCSCLAHNRKRPEEDDADRPHTHRLGPAWQPQITIPARISASGRVRSIPAPAVRRGRKPQRASIWTAAFWPARVPTAGLPCRSASG